LVSTLKFRFALSATVYTDAQTCVGISTFTEGEVEHSTFESVKIWEDLTPLQRISAPTIEMEGIGQVDTTSKSRLISEKERELGKEWTVSTTVTVS
jgi:hypothetical protein